MSGSPSDRNHVLPSRGSGYADRGMADQPGNGDVVAAPDLPPFVVTDEDRTRWENAGRVARDTLGPGATPEAIWATQRVIFHDRETYPS